jgi:hypothetical protein
MSTSLTLQRTGEISGTVTRVLFGVCLGSVACGRVHTGVIMPKASVSVSERAHEFRRDGFYVSGKILMCKFCDCRLEFKRKDSLTKHCESEKHVSQKRKADSTSTSNPSTSRLSTLEESLDRAQTARGSKEEFIMNTTEAFIRANIPVEKLDHVAIRGWMNSYVKGSGDLPSASRLRQHYIPLIGAKKESSIRDLIKGKRVVIMCDETTDKGGRCVFNILLRTLDPSSQQTTSLAASVILDAANGNNCANAIVDTTKRYNIDFENIIAVATDSARYMTRCVTTLQGLIEGLNHVQCWAHKINLVGAIWQE